SAIFSREAFKLCSTGLADVLNHPNDIQARGRMLLGASLAGLAIENSMLGAAHAAANPLTAHYGLVHGLAVGMMLPPVVRFNLADPEARRLYAALVGFGHNGSHNEPEAAELLVATLVDLLDLSGVPRSLADCGVEKSNLPLLAAEASRQWTANFNPRPVTPPDFERLYQEAFEAR